MDRKVDMEQLQLQQKQQRGNGKEHQLLVNEETQTEGGGERVDLFSSAQVDLDNEKSENNNDSYSSVQTIDSIQALTIPVVASFSLLFMFFFFDSIQTAFVICTSGNFETTINNDLNNYFFK